MLQLKFSTKIATLLSLIGVAVGLGNVWRFPYMMGQYGGSAFLFIYILFTFLFGIPALIGELALGRNTSSTVVGAYAKAFNSNFGKIYAWFIASTIFIANAYYIVVISNIAYSGFYSIFYGFKFGTNPIGEGLNNNKLQLLISLITLAFGIFIISRGLKKGIERFSKIIVPFFGIIMIYLIYHVLTLPKAPGYLAEFLIPNFEKLTPKKIFAALGQAFFTLSLGGTTLVAYSNYIKKTTSLPKLAVSTALGDLSAALLASIFIIPAVLVYNQNLNEGFTLLFTTLPNVFSMMPMGRILGSLFILALLFIALLSSIAVLQLYSQMFLNTTKLNFKQSVFITGILEFLLIIPCALQPNIIGTLDLIFGSGMQIFGSCIAMIALTFGIGKRKTIMEIFNNKEGVLPKIFFIWIKWIIPITLFLVLGIYLYNI